jgi:tetratricopeptide (TPR) repeat protein
MSKSCGRDIQERARLLLEGLLNYEQPRDRERFERLLRADLESSPKPRRGYAKNQKLAFNIFELNDGTGRVIEASLYSLAKLTKFTGNKELTEQQVDGVIYCLCLKEFGIVEQSSGQGATIRKLILKYENILNRFDDACQRWNADKSKFHNPSLQKSQSNPTHHNNIPSNIPRSGVSFDRFFGRSHELEQLHQMLQQGNHVAITAIAGMGGVGKTELAIQYAQEHLQRLKRENCSGGVCWLLARDSDVGAKVVEFAKSHFPNFTIPDGLTSVGQVEFCWQNWLQGDVLVVLDDVTDYKLVKPYLPPKSSQFKVLMTTRLQLGSSIRQLSLDVLKPLAAIDLLKSLVERERIKQEPWVARRICKWLGYLPLGLELVGRYLKRKQNLSLAEMLSRLDAKRLEELSLKKPKTEDDMTAQLGVVAAFELSWQELDAKAKQLGCLLSLFALAPIPWHLIEQCLSEFDPLELEEIRDESLLTLHLLQHKGKGIYQLHQLMREFFREKLEHLAEEKAVNIKLCSLEHNITAVGYRAVTLYKRAFAAAMVAVARQIPAHPSRELLVALSPTIPHLAEVANHLTAYLSNEELMWPCKGLGGFYECQGFYEQAAPWYEKCLSVTQSRFGSEHRVVAASRINLGRIYAFQGRYGEAEPLLVLGLELMKRLVGEEHPTMARSLNNLGNLYVSQGRYSEAEPLFMQALKIDKLLGQENPEVATSLNNLAHLYYSQGRYSEAEPLFVQTLELRQRLLPQEHTYVSQSLNNLAATYYYQGRYEEAEPLYVQALELLKCQVGEKHCDVAQSLNNLARLYQSQSRYKDAQRLYGQALTIYEHMLGSEHPYTVTCWENYIVFLRQVILEGCISLDELQANPLGQAILDAIQAEFEQTKD